MHFVAIKMGRRQGGPSRTGGGSGAYLNRYVTDEQRGRLGVRTIVRSDQLQKRLHRHLFVLWSIP